MTFVLKDQSQNLKILGWLWYLSERGSFGVLMRQCLIVDDAYYSNVRLKTVVQFQVIAAFEENLVTRPGHNGGDGTSTSSVGTASPDIFQSDTRGPIEGIPVAPNSYSTSKQPQGILDDYKQNNSLQVKYVESFSPHSSHSTLTTGEYHEAVRENGGRHLEGRSSGSDIEGYDGIEHGNEDHDGTAMPVFKREPARKSLKSDHLDRWINMQESYSEVSIDRW